MFTVFFVEEINLIVKDFHADQDHSPLIATATQGLHLASLWVLLVYMLVIVVDVILSFFYIGEEEGQEDEVMVEVLQKMLVDLVQVKGRCWCLHVVL